MLFSVCLSILSMFITLINIVIIFNNINHNHEEMIDTLTTNNTILIEENKNLTEQIIDLLHKGIE